jgi:integrase
MGKIRTRDDGTLFFDFRYQGCRCREYTRLSATRQNRTRMQKVLNRIESAIELGQFDYETFFPNSKKARKFARAEPDRQSSSAEESTPTVGEFDELWLKQNEVTWKASYIRKVDQILNRHLLPQFSQKRISDLTKAEILEYRAQLAKDARGTAKSSISPGRINQIIGLFRQILDAAADQYEITNAAETIKPLKQKKTEVDPMSLDEIQRFLSHVDSRYHDYFVVRFFTGLRSSEVDGLKWRYVDFERQQLVVRETRVQSQQQDSTKTLGSQRVVQLNSQAFAALQRQWQRTGGDPSALVFQSAKGTPLTYRNVANRVWYPALDAAGLRRRRPYQTRHTAATIWLAAGESPEWIAQQLGHSDTKMLFTVYSRFVPNLTRKDGSAVEQLLASRLGPTTYSNSDQEQTV